MNRGVIDNLPATSCVEVPCTIDANGIHPHGIGSLSIQCAALGRTNIIVQELCVDAIRNRGRERAFQALLLDPITSANLTIEKARSIFDELWAAEGDMVRGYE